MIVGLSTLFLLVLFWPVVRQKHPEVADKFYEWRLEYKQMKGKRKGWKLLVKKAESIFGLGLISWVDRLLRLAGRPGRLHAVEFLLILLLLSAGLLLLSTQVANQREAMYLIAILVVIVVFLRLKKMRDKRQLEAREVIRFLKRRFATQLRMRMPLEEALREIAQLAPGSFGITFRSYVDQIGQRSLREVMTELSREYEVRELDEFCVALALSDQKTPEILAEMISRQVREETARLDEFINNKSEATKGKMIGLVALTAVWTMALSGYFAYFGLVDRFKGGGGFLFF